MDPTTGRVGPSVGHIDLLHKLTDYVIQRFYPEASKTVLKLCILGEVLVGPFPLYNTCSGCFFLVCALVRMGLRGRNLHM